MENNVIPTTVNPAVVSTTSTTNATAPITTTTGPIPTTTPDIGPQTVNFAPIFRRKISRLFIFRRLRVLPLIIPLYIWAMWISIVGFLHFWYKLILGRRQPGLWRREVRFMQYITRWGAYFRGIIDQRPKIIGD